MRIVRSLAIACVPALAAAAAFAQNVTAPAPVPPPAAAQGQPARLLKVLAAAQPGSWRLRMIEGSSETPADVCLADPRLLVQLRHGPAHCDLFVAADEEKMAAVSYTCPGAGSGRTTLRAEPAGVLRIDSQGVAGKAPFAFVAEARRTGDCSAPPAAVPVASPAAAPPPPAPAR